ncbi:MAG: ABC transporter ATP-binding protein [Candidatus Angelobacter sp. Gp1-AA117]|nr:MAG: ABC transporter ATP-binding protein [Candidatus Angelobacter sp. Gp1-AA117]
MHKNLRPLYPYLWKYKGTLLFGAVCVVFTNGIWVLFPQVIRRATDFLDRITSHQGLNGLMTGEARHQLLIYCLLLLAVAFSKGIFQFLTRWLVIGISREIEYDLRNDLFRHLESLSYSFYQKTRTGDIMARMTNDLNAVRMLLGPAIMYSANTIVFTAAALFFMWRTSHKLTLYAVVPLPLASITIQYFGRKIHERFERIQAQFSDISARAQENFSGARVIRAYVQEDPEIALFEKSNQEYVARSLPLARLMGMLWPSLEAMLGVAVVMVLWLGGREVLLHRMTVGQFIAFNTYMIQLTWPIIALGWVINIFQRGTASMGRINEILSAKPEISDAEAMAQSFTAPINGDIEIRNLNFSYNGVPVLRDINLSISAGSSLAIVGPTGSGKTTLVSLIPRIYDAPSGSLLLDGRSIREYPLALLRRNIGFVPQETFLFSDTVKNNIAFGTETADDHEVRAAAEAANIAADIESFPEQYETIVGERGITLSGGQKQRSAIARAIIRNPRILILDDALSSVDTYTEEKILNHLRQVMHGRTTIFISHRVSTVRNADRIAVLHQGRIVELGTHDELLERNGYYTDLYNKQLLEEELASAS